MRQPIYQNTACYGHFGRDEFPSMEMSKEFENLSDIIVI